MLIVISPAKTLDFTQAVKTQKHTQPDFLDRAQELNQLLRHFSSTQLGQLMSISQELADLNVDRNQHWQIPFTASNAKQALFAFRGDVYAGMEADSFKARDLDYAQKHLRILSGLYGLLRPLDLIQAYRLEMGSPLANPKGKNLYAFWKNCLTEKLNQELEQQENAVLLNLASQEYFSAVSTSELAAPVCIPVFKDYSNGQFKVLGFYAKKARGAMASWIIKNRLDQTTDLHQFAWSGYQYQAKLSSGSEMVFTRKLQ